MVRTGGLRRHEERAGDYEHQKSSHYKYLRGKG
jgi:hypothetical protein